MFVCYALTFGGHDIFIVLLFLYAFLSAPAWENMFMSRWFDSTCFLSFRMLIYKQFYIYIYIYITKTTPLSKKNVTRKLEHKIFCFACVRAKKFHMRSTFFIFLGGQ